MRKHKREYILHKGEYANRINETLKVIKQKEPMIYQDGETFILQTNEFCLPCRYSISFGMSYYCSSTEITRKLLNEIKKSNGLENILNKNLSLIEKENVSGLCHYCK